jgi:hypothetical protein
MTENTEFPPILRIRCRSGEQAGTWLWALGVSKGGVLLQSPNWSGILQDPTQYAFHPQFVRAESAAFRPKSRAVAAKYLRVLAAMGIEAEIVEVRPQGKPSRNG